MLIIILFPLIIILALLVKADSSGPIIYWSNRVGKNNQIFSMPKFRTMLHGTEDVATHLMKDPHRKITKLGLYLRNFSLDEIPQLFSILKGDMSFVGPRPALHNQDDLISMRTQKFVDCLVPGITGWAQINGRDELTIRQKVEFDIDYLNRRSFFFDLFIILLTIKKVLFKSGVSH